MSDELVVSQCAPTLAGLKTANMFSAEYESREEVTAELRRLNAVLVPRDCASCPCGSCKAACFISLSSRGVAADLCRQRGAVDILRECGYGKCSRAYEERLIGRLRNNADFSNEVGLFLGYPPEDVRGFIETSPPPASSSSAAGGLRDVDAARKKLFEELRAPTAAAVKALDEIIHTVKGRI